MAPLEVEGRMDETSISPRIWLRTPRNWRSQNRKNRKFVLSDLYDLWWYKCIGCIGNIKRFNSFYRNGIIVPKITSEEFNRLSETKEVIDEKYYNFNQLKKVSQKFCSGTKTLFFFQEKSMINCVSCIVFDPKYKLWLKWNH